MTGEVIYKDPCRVFKNRHTNMLPHSYLFQSTISTKMASLLSTVQALKNPRET